MKDGHMADSDPRPRLDWQTETVLLCSGAFANIAMSSLAPAIPSIGRELGDTGGAAIASLLFSAAGLGVIVFSPLTGAIIRRFGGRTSLAGAYIAFAVAGTAGIMLPNIPLIAVSRFIAGGAGAMIVALGLILIGDAYEGRPRERRIGAYHAMASLALAIIMPFAGLMADINWRLVFLVHLLALPMIGLAIGGKSLRGEFGRAKPVSNISRGPWLNAPLAALLAVSAVAGAIIFSIQIYMPLHLHSTAGGTGLVIGFSLSASVVTMLLTSLLYAEIRRFVAIVPIFLISLLILALGLFVVAETATVAGTVFGMAITGIAGGLFGPNLFTAVSVCAPPEGRAHAIGFTKALYYFGPFAGPVCLQMAGLSGDPDASLQALAIASALLGMACLCLAPLMRGPPAPDAA
jgi:MFS family permease